MKILETFRDAVQGLEKIIPTDTKVEVIRSLLEVKFDYLDIGSFVSPAIIPQFADMDRVLETLGTPSGPTKIFVLVANSNGAKRACKYNSIEVIGFPFSTSPTFLKKNINAEVDAAWTAIEKVQEECLLKKKTLMVYLAMAFGNPYNDPVNVDICMEWSAKLLRLGVRNIHLSDIIGVAEPEQIAAYYNVLVREFPEVEFGIHLHTDGAGLHSKIRAAYESGCTVFDGVISGLGGCPMTGYEMLGNLPTHQLIDFALKSKIDLQVDQESFLKAREHSITKIYPFSTY